MSGSPVTGRPLQELQLPEGLRTNQPGDGPVRVLIVGCGVIGRTHATVLTRHPDFTVTAVVDLDASVAEEVVALIDADPHHGQDDVVPEVFGSIAKALASRTVDLAVIATPSGLHVQQASECLAGDVHVVIEKPLDADAAAGRELAALAAEAAQRGILVSVISQHRFDPASTVVRAAIEEQRLGTLTSAVATMAWFRSQQYYDSGDWRGTWALDGGGAVMNQGVHTVDLLRWFLGRPVEVYAHIARLAHEGVEIEDTATATVRFASGALAVIHATTAAYPGLTARIQVHGTRGSAIIDNDQLRYFHAGDGAVAANLRSAATTGNQAAELVSSKGGDEFANARNQPDAFLRGHLRQYDDIAAALRDHRPPVVDATEALLSLTLVRAVYVSATLGKPVAFDDVLAGTYDDVVVAVGAAA